MINLADFQIESENSSVSLYIYIGSACGVLILVSLLTLAVIYKCNQEEKHIQPRPVRINLPENNPENDEEVAVNLHIMLNILDNREQ